MQDFPSSPVARQQSVRLVVERLLRDRSVSRAEIARSTGLSKQTISEVMRELERDGWVHEDGQIQGTVGRSAVTYALRPDAACVLGIDIAIENDVNLAAIGEHWRGNSRKARTFAFVALGTGIGMGIFADGHLIRGARGAAGEVAYLPLGGDPYDTRGQRLGTLETAIGSAGIIERYIGLGGAPGSTVRDVLDRLETDEAARITIDEVGRVVTT